MKNQRDEISIHLWIECCVDSRLMHKNIDVITSRLSIPFLLRPAIEVGSTTRAWNVSFYGSSTSC